MKPIKWPDAVRFLIFFILVAASFSVLLVVLKLPVSLLSLFMIPILVSAWHYPRRVYGSIILISLGLEIWVAWNLAENFLTTMTPIFIALISMSLVAEIISRLVKRQTNASAAVSESEEKFRTLVEQSSEGIMLVDEDGKIIEYNASMARMTGILRSEALGRYAWDYRYQLLPDSAKTPEAREKIKADLLEAIHTGHSFLLNQTFETAYRTADGSVRIFQQTLFTVKTNRGYRLGTLNLDITQRKEVENALRQSEEHYRQIIENQGAGIGVVDTNEIFTFVNPATEKLFGAPPGGMVGRSFSEFLTHEQFAIIKKQKLLRQKGIKSSYEIEITRLDGGKRNLLVTASPQQDAEGHYTGAMGIFFDITERKHGEKLQNALYKISESAASAQNLADLYQSIHAIIGELIPANNFYITLHDPVTNMLSFPYHVDEYDANPGTKPFEHGLTEYVIRTGQPVLASPEEFERLELTGEVQSIGTPSVDWVGVPLKSAENKTFGALVVQTYTEGMRYSQQDMDVLSFVSRQVAMAVDRKRIEESERQQRTMAEALRDTASALNSTLQFDEVLARILANLDKVVPHDASTLMLVDDGTVRVVRYQGYKEHNIPEPTPDLRMKLENMPLLQAMAAKGHAVLIEDVSVDHRWVNPSQTHWRGAYVGTSIQIRGDTVGFINLNSLTPGFYTHVHAERLKAFANQAATAIENSRLYAQVQTQAIIDSLTGLHNRSLFDSEMNRLQGSRMFPISIMMIDVDGMKETNDRLGHAAGDELLMRAANVFRVNFRGEDIVARVGGDEFAILLPNTDKMAVLVALDRVKEGLSTHNAIFPGAPLRMSLGVATGEVGSLLSDVWKMADASMYQDKESKKC